MEMIPLQKAVDQNLPIVRGFVPIENKELYLEAEQENYKDEVCELCNVYFAPYHHFVRCAETERCPAINKKDPRSLLDMILGEDNG